MSDERETIQRNPESVAAWKRECAFLREQVEKLTKERDALKTVPMKYRRMQFNAELQEEVTQLREQLAALAEQNEKQSAALKLAKSAMDQIDWDVRQAMSDERETIQRNPESVAAWKRECAFLREQVEKNRKDVERLHAILETLKMEFYIAEIDAHHPEVHAIRKLRTSLFAKLTEILKAPAMQEDKP